MPDTFEQLVIDSQAPVEDGYAHWLWDREKAVRRVSEVWGLPIRRKVRVRLSGIDREFTDMMRLAAMPKKQDRRERLSLRMGRHVFQSSEIEACCLDASEEAAAEKGE